MAETDPVSGLPKSEVEKPSNVKRFNLLSDQKGRADQLSEDLESEKGKMVLNKIREHLLTRVNVLIDNDGECRALKRLLVDMGVEISVGDMTVEKLMRMVIGRK